MAERARILAVLGPTNTGKTHYALERMLGYRSGVFGLPLRLLAREIYDKAVAARGPSVVALVTGEERIVPPRTQYWICTVEAMPEGLGTEFLAVDEIQLCADPERGFVFTQRLLSARGQLETIFLGADTMRGPINALVPGVEIHRRERMSRLSYTGSRKISRMPPRSAIVGFSVDQVYAIAELIRRQKGGAAVVMGALSPRTRNAQVALYQSGQVDYLVATDAIGMGLNLDIHHVAFSNVTKFDGRRMRVLAPNELGQIAGRAGRGARDGTFGVTGEAPPLDDEVARAIVDHRFTPLQRLQWRNSVLNFGSIDALIRSLETAPERDMLIRTRDADDLQALRNLSERASVYARASTPSAVKLLWDVCRIPDFRSISPDEHATLLEQIFGYLHQDGQLPAAYLARHIQRIDRMDGDIDALSRRLAFIRTWTYITQRRGWVDDEIHWREVSRSVEDRLSDALHDRLTQRFVDRRTSILLRRLKQKEALLAEVNDKGEVTIEGEFVGQLEGFRFRHDKDSSGQEAKTIKNAALQALAPHFHLKADRFYNAPDTEIDFTDQGGLMWGTDALGKLAPGESVLKPRVIAFVDDDAGPDVKHKVERRLQHFVDRKIASLFEPLMALQKDESLGGLARGFAFRMVEALGLVMRSSVAEDVKALDQDARAALRKHGLRFGQFTIFIPVLLKPASTRLRLLLWALASKLDVFPEAPPPGLVTLARDTTAPEGYDLMAGYRGAGDRAIRIDMLERLADMLRQEDSRGGFEAKPEMLSITGMTLEQFANLMTGLGYQAEKGEREKVKTPTVVAVETTDDAETSSEAPATPVDEIAQSTPLEATEAERAAPDAQEADHDSEAPQEESNSAQLDDASLEISAAETSRPEVASSEVSSSEVPGHEITNSEVASSEASEEVSKADPQTEIFYTFTWRRAKPHAKRPPHGKPRTAPGEAPRDKNRASDGPAQDGETRSRHKKPKNKFNRHGQKDGPKPPRSFEARPKKQDRIDPDNPFAAALMGLRKRDNE